VRHLGGNTVHCIYVSWHNCRTAAAACRLGLTVVTMMRTAFTLHIKSICWISSDRLIERRMLACLPVDLHYCNSTIICFNMSTNTSVIIHNVQSVWILILPCGGWKQCHDSLMEKPSAVSYQYMMAAWLPWQLSHPIIYPALVSYIISLLNFARHHTCWHANLCQTSWVWIFRVSKQHYTSCWFVTVALCVLLWPHTVNAGIQYTAAAT